MTKNINLLRWLVVWRDCFSCQYCGSEDLDLSYMVLSVHHIDGNRKNDEIKNLVTLCPHCHLYAHNGSFCNKPILPFPVEPLSESEREEGISAYYMLQREKR